MRTPVIPYIVQQVSMRGFRLILVFDLTKKLLALLTLAMGDEEEVFYPLLSSLVKLGAQSQGIASSMSTVVMQIVGPMEGDRLLRVLVEAGEPTAHVTDLYRHALKSVLVNLQDKGVFAFTRIVVVAKSFFPLLSASERSQMYSSICQIDLPTATLRELNQLDHTVASVKIIPHLLDHISVERLREVLSRKDQEDRPSAEDNLGDGDTPLFFIDTGSVPRKPRTQEESEGEEEESEGGEEEEMQFFE